MPGDGIEDDLMQTNYGGGEPQPAPQTPRVPRMPETAQPAQGQASAAIAAPAKQSAADKTSAAVMLERLYQLHTSMKATTGVLAIVLSEVSGKQHKPEIPEPKGSKATIDGFFPAGEMLLTEMEAIAAEQESIARKLKNAF